MAENDASTAVSTIDVVWEGGQRFRGGEPGGDVSVLVDGSRVSAPSPVDALIVALGSCSGIDVADILEKRRTPVESLRVGVDFTRAESPPRRITSAHLRFEVRVDSEPHHVERAISLSLSKYCSVSNSLAPDVEITWASDVQPPQAS